jgi:hypothetical protein
VAVKFSEFSFLDQSDRYGRFVLEAPKGTPTLEFPFNPQAYLKLDPQVMNADSARLIISVTKGADAGSEFVFEPRIDVTHGKSLPNYITALRFELHQENAKLAVETESGLK